MAQTVEDIVLRLGIKGFDSLDSVRGAFRQLSRVTQASERDITLAREAILNYADAGKVTTRIIDAQIAGLKSLQGQAVINSRTYTQLGADISTLKARFTEATQEVARQTTVLDRQGSRVFGSSVASIKRYTESLRSTRTELAATSRSINATTADVDRLNTSLKAVDNFKLDINVDTTQVTQARGKVASAFAFFKRLGEQSRTPVGAVGRIFEGVTAGVAAAQLTGPAAAASGVGAASLAGISGRAADLQAGLNKASALFGGGFGDKLLGGIPENLAARSADLANLQNRFASLSEVVNSFNTALTSVSPTAAVLTGSLITAVAFLRQRLGNDLDAIRADIDESFVAVTDDIQKLIVELSRLGDYIGRMSMAEIGQQLNRAREAFASVPAGSPRSRSFASQIAGLESVQRGEARAQATVLEEYRDRVRGSSVTVEGLNERLQYLQQRMAGVNRATAEGTEEFRSLAAEAMRLQARITELGRMPTNYAVFAIRQRMAAQRETLAQSGFGAFSSEVRQRYEGIGGVTGERQAAAVREVQEAFGKWEEAYDQMLQVVSDHETAKRAIEEQANREHQARLDHNAAVELAKKKAANDALLAQFDASLKQRDLVARRHSLMAEALGVDGGRELSPLYERVVGLSSSSLRRQQAFMGKSPAEVYNDIVASFETGSRTNLLDNRSQQVGEGIAQGIVKGATDSDTLKKGSKSLVDKYLDFIFGDWDIHSPSGVSRREVGEPIGQGIVKGTVDAIKAGRKQIQAAIQFALGSPAKAPLPGGLGGPVSDVADKLQNFLIRSSARPSATLPFARLLGEGVTNSAALPLATYRRAYERGGIVPPTFLPVEQRRGLRGTAGIPGAGLEEVIRAEAMRAVGRTGAFVGPLASALRREVLQPVTRLSGAVPGISRPSSGATALPVFGTQAPALRQAPGIFAPYDLGRFQTDGPLTRGGQTFGRAAASSSLREALIKYRAATDNFWNGETGTYETLRRIISASAQVGASKLARNLSESRSRSAALSSAASTLIDRVTSPLVTLRTSIQTTAQQAGTKLRSLDIEAVKSVVPTAKQLVDQTLAPIKTLRTSLSTALQQSTTNLRELGSLGLSGLSFGMRGRGGMLPAGGGNLPPTPPTPPSGPGDNGADRGMDRLNTRLREFGPLSRRSISDLQDLRSVLDELQASLSPLDSDYAALNRQIDKQTAAIDRQLERRDRTRRRPLSGMQMAQGVGAALSGGIFGGPEGLIGGLGGLAFGGVGGAFAGAAAGAQVGMFRQQLAGFADYAASLDKMKIALRGIVKDQASYNTVLAAANAATRELNVPQEAAIGGLTRLSAAILGAGGTVNQSTFAFRALTEAVTATGGKAEQVDGAMLALTQVFSKGKVSAEELNQIAERLPGTYTLFAEATGRTGPQLAKGLEQGKIGLNDLMKFLELLRTKHGQTALEIAASSENAGERLKVAYDKMREDVGRALQPLGAQFQSVFAKALKDATPALINLAQGLAKVIQVLGANAGAIALVAKFGVVLTSTIYAGRAFAALGPMVSGAAALMGAAFGRTTAQAIMAERQLKLFAATARATAAALAGPIIISVAIVGADLVIDYFNRIRQARDRLKEVTSQSRGEQFLREIGGSALDKASVLRVANDVGRRYQVVQDLVVKLQREREQLKKDFEASPSMATYFGAKLNELEPRLQAAIAESALLESRYKTLVRRAPNAPTAPSMPGFAEPPGTAAGAAGAGADAAKQQRDLFQQANEYINANIELLKARGQLSEEQAATEFDRANVAKQFAIRELTLRKQALDLQKKYNQITPDIYTKSLQTLDVERQKVETAYNKTVAQIGEDISKINEEIFAGLGAPFDQRNVNEFERALDDLYQRVDKGVVDAEKKGGPPAAAFLKRARELTTADYQRAASRSTVETLTKQITELQRGKGEVTTLDTIIADYGDSWQKLEEPVRKHLEQLATTVDHLKEIQRYKQDPNTYAGLREGALAYVESIGTIRSSVADLAQTGFKGVEDSITSLMTTGTANFREFATSLIADMTRVIVRQFIMRSLMQALGFLAPTPAGAATGSASSLSQFNAGAAQYGTGLGFAKGGAFDAANRIVPFAYGGVVNKPTMFKFADGGLMRNGVAGEAGPEAIMPLRRLPSGRLGVESSGGGAAPITIQVNVDASGNQQMSGDAGQGQALGRVIAAVVQQELVNQKRPGGLLAS